MHNFTEIFERVRTKQAVPDARTLPWQVKQREISPTENSKAHPIDAPTSATEVPTRTPHKNATAVWSPVGSVVLFGGANSIESFVP